MKNRWPRAGLALIVWLLLIFGTSCTVVFVDDWIPFLQRISPDPKVQTRISDLWLGYGFFVVKGWHATEYAILTALGTATLRRWRGWSTNKAVGTALAIAVLYAASDEWHQTFIPGRDGCVRDVFIDTGGALLAATWLFIRARRATERIGAQSQ